MKEFHVFENEAIINVMRDDVIVNFDNNEVNIFPDIYTKLVIPFEEFDYSINPSDVSKWPVSKIVNIFRRPVKTDILFVEKKENETIFYLSRKRYLEKRIKDIKVGENYIARIVSVIGWGIFCKIDDGIVVLIHCSEISKAFLSDVGKCFEVGSLIRIKITRKDVYNDHYRLSGSRKQAYYPENFKKGDKVRCLITSKLDCGDFINDTSWICEVTPCQKGIFHIQNGSSKIGNCEYGIITKIEKEGYRIRRDSDFIER